MQIQDAAMELLVNALADMKLKQVNDKIQEELMSAYKKIQSPNIQTQKVSTTVSHQPVAIVPKIELQNREEEDFDTTLTNDFDSITELANTVRTNADQLAQSGLVKKERQTKHKTQQEIVGKFHNFLKSGQQQDEYETVKAVTQSSIDSGNKLAGRRFTFKNGNVKTSESRPQSVVNLVEEQNRIQPTYRASNSQNINNSMPQQGQKKYRFKHPKVLQEQVTQTDQYTKTVIQRGQNEQTIQQVQQPQTSQVQQTPKQKQIIQIIELQKQSPKQKKPKKMQKTTNPSPQPNDQMIIKEKIVTKVKSKQTKHEKAIDIAAAVAAEYEKQLRKFQEEEGNKTVDSVDLKNLSCMIEEVPKQQLLPMKQISVEIPEENDTSTGEIWPRYDQKYASKLKDKGRGIGVWDRSVSETWDLINDTSEGEVQIFRDGEHEEQFYGC